MVEFAIRGIEDGLDDQAIKRAAAEAFSSDRLMIKGALEFLASWALTDTEAVRRKKAIRELLSGSTQSIFRDLRDGQAIHGKAVDRLLSGDTKSSNLRDDLLEWCRGSSRPPRG